MSLPVPRSFGASEIVIRFVVAVDLSALKSIDTTQASMPAPPFLPLVKATSKSSFTGPAVKASGDDRPYSMACCSSERTSLMAAASPIPGSSSVIPNPPLTDP